MSWVWTKQCVVVDFVIEILISIPWHLKNSDMYKESFISYILNIYNLYPQYYYLNQSAGRSTKMTTNVWWEPPVPLFNIPLPPNPYTSHVKVYLDPPKYTNQTAKTEEGNSPGCCLWVLQNHRIVSTWSHGKRTSDFPLYILYCMIHRYPYNGLLYSLYNWVVWSTI